MAITSSAAAAGASSSVSAIILVLLLHASLVAWTACTLVADVAARIREVRLPRAVSLIVLLLIGG